MNENNIKNESLFKHAMRPWCAKHVKPNIIVPSQDLKRARFKNQSVIVLDSGDKPGSFLVCACVPKYLRTILFFTQNVTFAKTQLAYTTRARSLKAFIQRVQSIEWDHGVYQGQPCLYASDLKSYLAVSTYLNIDGLEQDVLTKAYNLANDEYHRGSSGASFLTDDEYDELERYLLDMRWIDRRKLGSNIPTTPGARLVPLPNVMPSLEYEKTTDKIINWANSKGLKGFIRTPKIDGISLQLIYKRGVLTAAYTRGNGEEAELKTVVVKACPGIPQKLTQAVDLECRVEAYMEEKVFEKKYSQQSGTKYRFTSARACVAGMFNRKIPDLDILQDVKIAAFEAYKGIEAKTKTEMLNKLRLLGLPVVPAMYIALKDIDKLNTVIVADRARSPVAMDGIVLEPDDLTHRDRVGTETNSINPAWAKAFKPSSEGVLAEVVRVEWNVSPHGYLKPVVYVKAVK